MTLDADCARVHEIYRMARRPPLETLSPPEARDAPAGIRRVLLRELASQFESLLASEEARASKNVEALNTQILEASKTLRNLQYWPSRDLTRLDRLIASMERNIDQTRHQAKLALIALAELSPLVPITVFLVVYWRVIVAASWSPAKVAVFVIVAMLGLYVAWRFLCRWNLFWQVRLDSSSITVRTEQALERYKAERAELQSRPARIRECELRIRNLTCEVSATQRTQTAINECLAEWRDDKSVVNYLCP